MAKIVQKSPDGKAEMPASRRSAEQLQEQISEAGRALADWAVKQASQDGKPLTFLEFEQQLLPRLFALGRVLMALFLEVADRQVCGEARSRGEGGKPRWLSTTCGWVRYWRHYARRSNSGGHCPTDVALGLTADQESWHLLSLATRLVTKMAYAEARNVLGWFTFVALSTEVMGRAVLGLGRYTQEWFERPCSFEGDGSVLVILIDSKGGPTATDEELARRRRSHGKGRTVQSVRHRHRSRRNRYDSKPRRKKGDKSKHARMATMVVMYTLTRVGRNLLGPVNRWCYASFAPKAHAVAVAQRAAIARGFGPDSGKTVQVLTDGDNDLARYIETAFPWAKVEHTIDVIHVVERLWRAGEVVYEESSLELRDWVEVQKKALYAGDIAAVLAALRQLRNRFPQPTEQETPRRGPRATLRAAAANANPAAGAPCTAVTVRKKKGPWTRLNEIITYIEKRQAKMKYGDLRRRDLEIGTGAVEGAIKHIIGQRFDHGGMRWIRERAEALLQLRCIEVNGDWDRFVRWVHDKLQVEAREKAANLHLLQNTPGTLPTFTLPERSAVDGGEQAAASEEVA